MLDIANSIQLLLSDEERATFVQQFKPKRAASGKGGGKRAPGDYKDADKDGKRPEPGAKYKLPNGTVWEKKTKVGAANKDFLAHIKDKQVTWASLKA